MNSAALKIIELTEYELKSFPRDEIPESAGIELYHKYKHQIDVQFPNYKTDNKWQLKPKGWVGYIPLTTEIGLKLNPKVTIRNLLGMLEYAYDLKSFHFLKDLIDCDSLEDFYNHLAQVLAQEILKRCRKGLYRTYLHKTQQLAYVRGKLDVRSSQKPWDIKLKCHYDEHTADIAENQILAWTLLVIGRSGLCSQRVLPTVRKAYHALQGIITIQSCSPKDCIGRQYNRLNEDYQSLHALCRFFLENSGPSHERGSSTTLPFIIDMARLYELFVAEWLKAHLPPNLTLKSQERINLKKTLHFQIDVVIYDTSTRKPKYIIDTKYKTPASPSSDDVAQVIAYAVSKNCQQAILLYPTSLTHALDQSVGDIQVRSLIFYLDKNLDQAGNNFLENLLNLSEI